METTGTRARGERAEETQYITFSLADEIYGIEVLKAHEIVGMQKIAHVPKFMISVYPGPSLRSSDILRGPMNSEYVFSSASPG